MHSIKVYSVYLIAFVQILGKKKKKNIINTKYSNTFYQIEYINNKLYIIL